MTVLEVRKNKGKLEANVYYKKGEKSMYTNIVSKDPKQLAQLLIDLNFLDYPIENAVKIFLERLRKKDWFGL